MLFFIVFALVCIQRLIELRIAKQNEVYLKERGAIEFGQSHYPFIVALHILFLCSLLLEYILKTPPLNILWIWLLAIFFLLQISRIWVIKSLGHFWNTKIIVLPNANLVKKGPYRWISHPNYVIVALEIVIIPLIFQAYFTAVIFTILNMIMMLVRIPTEEAALRSVYKKGDNLAHLLKEQIKE